MTSVPVSFATVKHLEIDKPESKVNISPILSQLPSKHTSIKTRNISPNTNISLTQGSDSYISNDGSNEPSAVITNFPQFLHPMNTKMNTSVNIRLQQTWKEYLDTESISSSDIRDDISSIASDDHRRSLPPPSKAPPPPPTNKNIFHTKHRSNSMSHSLTNKLYQNRRTVLTKLSLGNKSKKDVLKKLETSIFKVENRLKLYIHELVSLQTKQKKYYSSAKNELKQWKTTANWDLQSLCNSYYANIQIYINIKLQIITFYCQCFSQKYRSLKKIHERIKRDIKRYTVDDLILSVEAAMMTAANIRLPLTINQLRNDQKCFASVVDELKVKYDDKKTDTSQAMSTNDRMKHVLTMLVQIVNSSNGTKHISDGLPYYHSIDNGFQFSFEQLLFDPHFPQSKIVSDWKSNIMRLRMKFYANPKSKKHRKAYAKILSFSGLSTFAYYLTNSFLESCELTEDKAYYQQLFFDASNLMTCRALFPRVHVFMDDIKVGDEIAVENDRVYEQKIRWMCCLSQMQMGIEDELQWYRKKKNGYSESFAYSEPIFRLHGMTQTYVPQDSIVCVIDSIHDIQKCAMRYYKYNNGRGVKIITNDCLFPIITYCVVQSGIKCWHQWISMMEKFYTPNILRFGQTGFCFSEICAAVKYIMIQKPSFFGLDDDID